MNHYVYQITNNINGKIYIGKRSCKRDIQDDNYMGSGYHLNHAIKQYGKENFTKTIIDICESPEIAYELEALIVDDEFLKRPDTYNLVGGGRGPTCISDETKLKISENHNKFWLNKPSPMTGKIMSMSAKLKLSIKLSGSNNPNFGKTGELSPSFGKTHSVETRFKMSQAHLNRFNTDDRINKNELIKTKLISSDIDFTKFGWVGKAAIIINIAPQKVNGWMKRNMLDFYETNCFKRNNINALIR